MIFNRHDSIMMEGYKRALNDLMNFIDNHSRFFKSERVMDIQAVKSLLMCIHEECESFYTYGTFDRRHLYLSPAKDKNGKKQVRRFFLKDKEESLEYQSV